MLQTRVDPIISGDKPGTFVRLTNSLGPLGSYFPNFLDTSFTGVTVTSCVEKVQKY